MNLVRYADRDDLRAIRFETLSGRTFPEFIHHNQSGGRYWSRLYHEHPDFQLALVEGDDLIAELHSVPVPWDGTLADLPRGWDAVFPRAFDDDGEPTALAALAISVLPERQGEHLSSRMIEAMRAAGAAHGLHTLIAPVRPTLKQRYPLIPIEAYMAWRRPDGSHFDPWIRVHERVGGRIIAPARESMLMEAPVADWEAWTGLEFPDDGDYVVPEMLAPLIVRDGVGRHVEPNVWLAHTIE